MDSDGLNSEDTALSPTSIEAIRHLTQALEAGENWAEALLESVSLWTTAQEVRNGRRYGYLIAGEAFDFLTLSQRLFEEVDGLVPQEGKETLLFSGTLPGHIDDGTFRRLLGAEKYSGYLNYFYGITVEEALLLSLEEAIRKEHTSKGFIGKDDYSDEAYQRLYRQPRAVLLQEFRQEKGYAGGRSIFLGELKEFTYWLFKNRIKTSDPAKAASDTVRGLKQLMQMGRESPAEDISSFWDLIVGSDATFHSPEDSSQ